MTYEEIEACVAADPENAELRYQRAWILEELGRIDEAKNGYLDVLRRSPEHFGAINNLGAMLSRLGFQRAAATLYARAAELHPANAIGHINLGSAAFALGEYAAAKDAYTTALALSPNDRTAHHGLANALSRLGDDAAAERHFARAFEGRPVIVSPYFGASPPANVVTLFDASTGNLHTHQFVDEHRARETKIAVGFFDPSNPLPPHDLVFNAIGDADRCGAALERAVEIVAKTSAPVINHPALVLKTRRIDAARYAGVRGLTVPVTRAVARAALCGTDGESALRDAGLAFPLLLRTPGYHNGEHFAMVDSAQTLVEQARRMPADWLLAIQYVDARGSDGAYRKYRAILVDGRLYPLHLAVSRHWKVHFFSADMAENARNRAEDAAFLNDMPGAIGERAAAALQGICDILRLDYAGIDFGLDRDGNAVLFEANAAMVVPEPPPDPRWDYRRPHVARIVTAMAALLSSRLAGAIR